MTTRFTRKRKSNEENDVPKEIKPNQLLAKRMREAMEVTQISGRVKCIELENFMCHEKLKVEFDLENNNCFYIGGPNGSGKSALFAAMNIGLGGRGNHNDRGNSIRIVMTNTGQSSHPSYGDYSIVERTINQTSSTYVLKTIENGKEVRVSTRKGDLDKLMNRYGIQLVNPIFWMSQDRSRHFLQQMKPEKLYEIFMFATELDSTRDHYREIDQFLFDMTRVIKRFEKNFGDRKAEIKKMAEHRSKICKIDEKEHDIADYQSLEEKQAEAFKSNATIKERIQANREERSDFQLQTEQLNKAIGAITENSATECAGLREAEAVKRQLEMEMKGVNESITHLRRDEREQENQIKAIESDIKKREDALMSNGKVNEKMQVERRLREIAEEINEIENKSRESKNELESVNIEWKKKENEKDKIDSEKYQSERNMKSAVEDLQQSEAVAKNALAKFGRDVPNIVDAIKKNVSKFEREPLGPLGQYLNVKEEKWTVAVESAINRNLESFVLHSQRDRQVFFDLCRQIRVQCPNVIVANFNIPPHDTRRNEPSPNIPTVERMISFSNQIVRNCLIDTTGIESIMLIETDDEARELLNGSVSDAFPSLSLVLFVSLVSSREYPEPFSVCPFNIRKAFTRSGGSGTGKNSQGGIYRFYPNFERDPRPKFLMAKKNYDVQQLNYIIDTEKAKVKQFDAHSKKMKQLVDDLVKLKFQVMKRIQDMDTRKNSIEGEKRRLERKLDEMGEDDTDDTAINSLKESIAEYRLTIEKNHVERDGFIKDKTRLEHKLKEARSAVSEARKRVDNAQTGSGPIEDRLREVRAEIDRLDATHEKFVASQRKINIQIDSFHKEFVALEKKKEKALETAELRNSPEFQAQFAATGGKPKEFDDPPDFEDMPQTEEAQKMYDDKVLEVNAAKKALNAVNYDEAKYKEMVNDYNHNSKTFKKLKKIVKIMEAEKKEREEKLPILRQAVTMRLKAAFYKLMDMRDFRGILRVKNKEKKIEITVETHGEKRRSRRDMDDDSYDEDDDYEYERQDDDDEGNVKQDLKGLSGGERSYTTACFIMSLWEIMEAPFRCMDEFDVFMDMVNRKVVMEMLVKLATEQFAHNQFIFFTPQGIRELGKRDKVQIFEMPKV
ncbi:smc-6 [Pristionchus pacificus]|uniref:Structural maintenance of chromosomes protein 6 n=1 Tax=Pristionchus pacificus TaxID=54126 RepID=A0A2A6CIJ4_PRIPA|nr:smc-6 [Pristionchus pacificus]|eukprot:PDM78045.1 smc-6 [Pristionchus pacificus]